MAGRIVWTGILMLGVCASQAGLAADPPGVARLLEDNAAELLPQLTNPGGDGGEGEVEREVVFAGTSAIKITVYQKYFNLLPGWAYRITEKPKEGEYRYLRLAWKGPGTSGLMLQLHDERDWHIRYTSGANKFGWTTQFVSDKPPADWTLVTVDLFKDFGERELHGIALTAFDGTGYFDHIYLGRTIAALDNIDATGLAERGPLTLSADDLEKHYAELGSADASRAYRAFWTLAAGGESARTFLSTKLRGEVTEVTEAAIAKWIEQLDAEEYAVRERATAELKKHFAAARSAVETALPQAKSVEARTRLSEIALAASAPVDAAETSRQVARRILQVIRSRSGD